MPTESDLMFVQLPDGTIKGPFESRKIIKTYRAGRVPNGSRVSSSREGPWQRVTDFARVSPEIESPLVVRPVMSAEAAVGGSGLAARTSSALPAPSPMADGLADRVRDAAPVSAPADVTGTPDRLHQPRPLWQSCSSLLERSWHELRQRYWAIVLRTVATLVIGGFLLALPTVIWIVAFLTEQFVDLPRHPWLASILGSTFLVQFLAPFVLVPFGFMFLVCGVLCVLGTIEGSEWSRWSSIIAWRRRFPPMMVLGYLAAGSEFVWFILFEMVLDSGDARRSFLEKILSDAVQSVPLLICLVAGMLVMTGKGAGGAFVRSIRSLDWAFRQLMHDRGTTLALSIGLITAMASGLLVISLPLLGLPFLFVVVGLAFRGYRQPERL